MKQSYQVSMDLELPETPGNFDMGVFMAKITVEGSVDVETESTTAYGKKKKNAVKMELPDVKKTQFIGSSAVS